MTNHNVFAVKDTHSQPNGRQKALGIINGKDPKNKITAFFIEWANNIDPKNIEGSFTGLAQNDAHPNLIELTKAAINAGIEVIPCDLTAAATVKALNELNDGYGPYNDPSVFQPWGKAIRDQHVAEIVRNYLKAKPLPTNCLIMFGSDHFTAEADRKLKGEAVPPLNQLISTKGIKGIIGIDCFVLS